MGSNLGSRRLLNLTLILALLGLPGSLGSFFDNEVGDDASHSGGLKFEDSLDVHKNLGPLEGDLSITKSKEIGSGPPVITFPTPPPTTPTPPPPTTTTPRYIPPRFTPKYGC